ncbi:unnamed protein product [Candida parapsilosis]
MKRTVSKVKLRKKPAEPVTCEESPEEEPMYSVGVANRNPYENMIVYPRYNPYSTERILQEYSSEPLGPIIDNRPDTSEFQF